MIVNILTFDIEEWFHIKFDNEFLDNTKLLNSFEKRLDKNIYTIFDLLDKYNQKATFFCLGYIAREYPQIVKEIDARGHDVGCHSDVHKLLFNFTKDQFEYDLKKALDSIESIIGKKVELYRAPAFSISNRNMWIFDVLIEYGIKIDCSISPVRNDFGGFENFPSSKPTIIKTKTNQIIKEFPVNTYKILGKDIIFSGGGYFRLFPYYLITRMMKNSEYVMTYLHPRDFDKDQPTMKDLSIKRRFKSYYGLKTSFDKLKKLLNDYDFECITEAELKIDWNRAYVYNL